jgi:hypothetical protein
MRIMLVATMRNEGPYILDWVAYHRLIGFTEIIVCSNDCSDGSPELLDGLEAQGLLRHIRCTPAPDEKAQLFAYGRAEAEIGGRWPDAVMVLDADEFLNIHVGGGTVPELLERTAPATSVMINWRIFGSGGAARWSPEPVLARYRRAAPRDHGVNRSFKTLVTRPDAYHCPLLPHGPGFACEETVGGLLAVDGAGRLLPDRYVRSEGFLQTEPGEVRWDLAQVNHYNTRSWEDYLSKHDRGGGLGPERWDRSANWQAFDRNEEEDLGIQRHLPGLMAERAALLALPPIRHAQERVLLAYDRHVGRLAAEVA